MAGVTTFSFDSNASDEDNDTLTYSWNFGDGDTGIGKTPTHVYKASGSRSHCRRRGAPHAAHVSPSKPRHSSMRGDGLRVEARPASRIIRQ
jgi:hypothetical protein